MHGLLRVRGFTQDDAHIFCTPEQIEDEIVNCLAVRRRHADTPSASTNTRPSFPPGMAAPAANTTARPSSGSWPRDALRKRTRRGSNMKVKVIAGRSRVLRSQDRRETGRRDRPAVAAFHRAVRFHSAAPLRPGIHRRRRQGASAADGAPRAVRFDRALLRHPDRALCRRVSGVAGAGAGDRAAHHRPADGNTPRRGAETAWMPPASAPRWTIAARK